MTTDILSKIDAATDNRCACGCGQPLPAGGPSGYFVDADCQRRWSHTQADRPQDVYDRPDAAPCPPGPMRWRPDLVTEAPDADLAPTSHPYRRGPHQAQMFNRRGRDVVHLRLDDGHRFVGVDVDTCDTDPTGFAFGERLESAWRRLERELGDSRRVEAVAATLPDISASALAHAFRSAPISHGNALTVEWSRLCVHCGQRAGVTLGRRTLHRPLEFDRDPTTWPPRVDEDCDLCAGCGAAFPGPPLRVSWEYEPRRWMTAMRCGGATLTWAASPGFAHERLDMMEAQLLAQFAADNPDRTDVAEWVEARQAYDARLVRAHARILMEARLSAMTADPRAMLRATVT